MGPHGTCSRDQPLRLAEWPLVHVVVLIGGELLTAFMLRLAKVEARAQPVLAFQQIKASPDEGALNRSALYGPRHGKQAWSVRPGCCFL